MRRVRLGAALAVGLLTSVLALPGQAAAPTGPTDPSAPAGVPANVSVRYHFDAGVGPAVWDDARLLRLRALGARDGAVRAQRRGTGYAAAFPAPCRTAEPECPRAILESDPAPWLNPGVRDVRWGAQVVLPPQSTTDGENVVQKGFSTQGTQFKLQVDHFGGLASCVVAGPDAGLNQIYVAQWNISVADGTWHKLDCVRHLGNLSLYVDGQLRAGVTVPVALSIVNPDPLRLGGKGIGPWNDQFHGELDDVYVTVG
ncbi:LamG-like jellyroll fold domain-containing protein [Hamadaea tsunoensis]|uniref:LamG-like jellyroll fold domain-containing protein n=1 Tax=Hamadaea tsunoensis TaxID=53368 RepID=UPI0003F7CF79|nr:LamG-like jellyroll fold domain-containing protein [Hamadaea tsunoensis]